MKTRRRGRRCHPMRAVWRAAWGVPAPTRVGVGRARRAPMGSVWRSVWRGRRVVPAWVGGVRARIWSAWMVDAPWIAVRRAACVVRATPTARAVTGPMIGRWYVSPIAVCPTVRRACRAVGATGRSAPRVSVSRGSVCARRAPSRGRPGARAVMGCASALRMPASMGSACGWVARRASGAACAMRVGAAGVIGASMGCVGRRRAPRAAGGVCVPRGGACPTTCLFAASRGCVSMAPGGSVVRVPGASGVIGGWRAPRGSVGRAMRLSRVVRVGPRRRVAGGWSVSTGRAPRRRWCAIRRVRGTCGSMIGSCGARPRG